jgi:tetratricopeptide (TPR) repeat protein
MILMIVVGGGYLFRVAFNTTDSSQKLFNEYFAPEYDLMTVRSITSSTTVLNTGMNHFANRDYAEAIESFNQMPDNMLGRLYAGFSFMHLEQYDDAEKKFKEIIDDGNNMFIDQAAWHLGLCYLATDETEQAKTILTDIANSNTFYESKALELLTRMGND